MQHTPRENLDVNSVMLPDENYNQDSKRCFIIPHYSMKPQSMIYQGKQLVLNK